VPRGMTSESWLKRTASSKNRVIVNMDEYETEAITLLASRAAKHPAELVRSWIRTKAKRLPRYQTATRELA
jgi:hypothetical protein